MSSYLIRRVLLMAPTLAGLSLVVFLMVRLVPGGPEAAFCSTGCTAEDAGRIRTDLGLDLPLPAQYLGWLTGVVTGDLGVSLHTKIPVASELSRRLPVTIELTALALLIASCVGAPAGCLAAVKRGTIWDAAIRFVTVSLLAVPGFWLATLLIAFGGAWFNWAPPIVFEGPRQGLIPHLEAIGLPSLVISASLTAAVARLTRTQLLEVLALDYITVARAKGLAPSTLLLRHAMRSSLLPVVTFLGVQLPYLLAGTVIIESIFQIPGMGQYFFGAISLRDYPVVQSVNLVLGLFVVVGSLLVDLCYSWLDPRTRVT